MIDHLLVLTGCILLGASITWKAPEQVSLQYALRSLLALMFSTFVIALGILFLWDYFFKHGSLSARDAFLQFLSTYLLCCLTNIDNLTIFLAYFETIPLTYTDQKRILKIGLIGNAIIRTGMLSGSLYMIEKVSWLSKFLAVPLLYAGYTMVTQEEKKAVSFLVGFKKIAHNTKITSQRTVSVMLAVITLLLSDAIFALDSTAITAALTNNYFIGQTANLMALLLQIPCYILLKKAKGEHKLLRKGLGSIIICIGFHVLLCG